MFQTKGDDNTQGNYFNELKFIKIKSMNPSVFRICSHKDLLKQRGHVILQDLYIVMHRKAKYCIKESED